MILNPAATRLLCGYGGDGGTRPKACATPRPDGCVPGCGILIGEGDDAYLSSVFCDGNSPDRAWCDGLPWRPKDIGKMLLRDRTSSSYNEVIVDGDHWARHLPDIIEAFVVPTEHAALQTYQRFLQTYRLSSADVPLVRFNAGARERPFSRVES